MRCPEERASHTASTARMITFRCTKRVIERFRLEPTEDAPASTGILGDWYANLLNVGPQRLVLCVSERTLLPVILPARRDSFPVRFGEHLRWMLERLAVPEAMIEAEVEATRDVSFARTRNRHVLGVLNDFGFLATVAIGEQNDTVEEAVRFLAQTPTKPLGHERPDRVARALFRGGTIS